MLGEEWLARWERSDAEVACTLSTSDEKEFEEKIRGHEQFRTPESKSCISVSFYRTNTTPSYSHPMTKLLKSTAISDLVFIEKRSIQLKVEKVAMLRCDYFDLKAKHYIIKLKYLNLPFILGMSRSLTYQRSIRALSKNHHTNFLELKLKLIVSKYFLITPKTFQRR